MISKRVIEKLHELQSYSTVVLPAELDEKHKKWRVPSFVLGQREHVQ